MHIIFFQDIFRFDISIAHCLGGYFFRGHSVEKRNNLTGLTTSWFWSEVFVTLMVTHDLFAVVNVLVKSQCEHLLSVHCVAADRRGNSNRIVLHTEGLGVFA